MCSFVLWVVQVVINLFKKTATKCTPPFLIVCSTKWHPKVSSQRITIKVLHGEGYSTTAIASKVKCSQGAVSARLKETGSTDDNKRSGRPKIHLLGRTDILSKLVFKIGDSPVLS